MTNGAFLALPAEDQRWINERISERLVSDGVRPYSVDEDRARKIDGTYEAVQSGFRQVPQGFQAADEAYSELRGEMLDLRSAIDRLTDRLVER